MNKKFYEVFVKNGIRQEYLKLVQCRELNSRYDVKDFIDNYQTALKGDMN